jgi:DNA (cytosine-5)-methyltransferase 1
VGQPAVLGVDDGIPNRVDRLGAAGNAIVPQVAYIIMQQMKEIL